MWPFRRSAIPTFEVDNIVGKATFVRGDLRGPGGFRVDGTVSGKIQIEGPVVIGEAGAVEGSIRARDVVVLGRVHGDVVAEAHLEIGPSGRVMGDVVGKSVRVHPGGAFHGAIHVGEGGEDAPRLKAPTNPLGVLPVSTAPSKPPSGRTLPPPVGAVVPPPPPTIHNAPATPTTSVNVTAKPRERAAPPTSGETRIDPPRKAAVNDS